MSEVLDDIVAREQAKRFFRNRWFAEWCKRAEAETSIGAFGFVRLAVSALLGTGRARWQEYRALRRILATRSKFRDDINRRILSRVLTENESYFDTVESKPLTQRQRDAAVSDEDANLVIAGAGTGKTSTVLAKIGLLLKTGQCTPREILAISFTRKSADELAERVQEKLGVQLDIHTFHKLGLRIIASAEGGKPRLAPFADDPVSKSKHIGKIIDSLCEDDSFKRRLIGFLAYQRLPTSQSWHFSTIAEYQAWLQANKIISLDGEPKKSYQECVIANWLLMNGVKYVYEDPYEYNTRTVDFRQYCPDFHVLEPNLYIEHFGVDEEGNPAPYIDAKKYREGMAWKRETHQQNGTVLIESFSWEHSKGALVKNLERRLKSHGVKLSPIPDAEVLGLMNKSGTVSGFADLVATFLTLYKGNGSRLVSEFDQSFIDAVERSEAFLELFHPIYQEYEQRNKEAGQIDFEDMISHAASAVRDGQYATPYRYILVDEFQDISPGRAELVNALVGASGDCALFAVGDDWQSIYRFAGSDIGAMTHFESIFGPTRRTFLDTTFRFDDYAIETTSRFVQKNDAQIRKELKAITFGTQPSILIYKRKEKEAPLDWSMKKICAEANGPCSVLILGRYNFDLPDEQTIGALEKAHPAMSFRTMTVHGAKGLEADYVIIGLRGGQWGFPATKTDDPLLSMVLTQTDAYRFGEERRLFYVAMTRARRKTFLVCETGQNLSVFADELDSERGEYRVAVFGLDTSKLACVKCKSGTMILRDGSNGKFYACSNFPLCRNTQQTCPACREGLLVASKDRQWECHICHHKARLCPRCKTGVLEQKLGKHGSFVGCSSYRDPEINCRHTEKGSLTSI